MIDELREYQDYQVLVLITLQARTAEQAEGVAETLLDGLERSGDIEGFEIQEAYEINDSDATGHY